MSVNKFINGSLVNLSGGSTGKNVNYDNTTSKLTAINIQDAIDEVNTKTTNKIDKSDILTTETQVNNNTANGKVVDAKTIKSMIDTIKTNFQAGVDSVYNAIVAKGTTPASKSLDDVVAGIGNINTGSVYYLGAGNTFSIAAAFPNDFKKLTKDNFIVLYGGNSASLTMPKKGNTGDTYELMWVQGTVIVSAPSVSVSYNATTGVLTVTASQTVSGNATASHSRGDTANTSASGGGSFKPKVYLSLTAPVNAPSGVSVS